MPDFTIEAHRFCSSHTSFEVEVPGSSGNTHVVRHERLSPGLANARMCEHDFTCTCPHYQRKLAFKGGYCKHILMVKSRFCGWSSCHGGGPESPLPEGESAVREVMDEVENACPMCGASTFVVRVAV